MGEYLIFDTETTTDPTQRFVFGWFRYVVRHGKKLHTLAEGIIYDDELQTLNGDGFRKLENYTQHPSDIDVRYCGPREPSSNLEFLSRAEFVSKWILNGINKSDDGLIVGFNLPFDLSRLAIDVGESRGHMRGGFSFQLSRHESVAQIRVKHLDSKKSLIDWTRGLGAPGNTRNFLDLRTLAFALTSRGYSLAGACKAFGIDDGKAETTEHGQITDAYIGYARQDVKATMLLLGALLEEYEKHDIDVSPERLMSPASLAKAYYRKMQLVPPLNRTSVTDEYLGYTMSAFYGARSECHIRHLAVPVTLVDFTSMYPTVNALMGLWRHLTAQKLGFRHDTLRVREFLKRITLEGCYSRSNWPAMVGIAKIRARSDILPARFQYTPGVSNIGVNKVSSDREAWYAIPDLVASVLLTGKVPDVVEAITFTHSDPDEDMRDVNFLGALPISPTDDDFFRWIIEERARVRDENPKLGDVLKIMANAGCYGIFIEMNRATSNDEVTVYGRDDSWSISDKRIDVPGEFCYPPIAVVITSAARLMLAMLETEITRAGGTWAFADTDSMAIVTGKSAIPVPDHDHDYTIPVLAPAVIDRIIRRFNALSPYDSDLVPNLLKTEFEGYAYVISAKRYCLFNSVGISKYSEHGLGHLRGPFREWVRKIWSYTLNSSSRPDWFSLPALTQWGVNTPSILSSLEVWNEGKSYADRIKPFNFVSVCYPRRESIPPEVKKFRLFAPFISDATESLGMPWANQYEPGGPTYSITTEREIMSHTIGVKTYGEIADEYSLHTEAKSSDYYGRPCTSKTIGLLTRRHMKAFYTRYIGKESNRIEERQIGLFEDGDVLDKSRPLWVDLRETIFSILYYHINQAELAKTLKISRVSIHRWQTGTIPTRKRQAEIFALAAHFACEDLGKTHKPADYVQLFMQWEEEFWSKRNASINDQAKSSGEEISA